MLCNHSLNRKGRFYALFCTRVTFYRPGQEAPGVAIPTAGSSLHTCRCPQTGKLLLALSHTHRHRHRHTHPPKPVIAAGSSSPPNSSWPVSCKGDKGLEAARLRLSPTPRSVHIPRSGVPRAAHSPRNLSGPRNTSIHGGPVLGRPSPSPRVEGVRSDLAGRQGQSWLPRLCPVLET